MSSIIYFASDRPLINRPNPHEKFLSVNEAIASRISNIPDYMLTEYFDKDRPDTIVINDREIDFNIDTGIINDGDFDDDFAIITTRDIYGLRSNKKYFAVLEWYKLTEGRALKIIEYIKEHLHQTNEIELWHIWLGAEDEYHSLRTKRLSLNQLTPEHIFQLEEQNLQGDFLTDYCYIITK